MAEDYLNFAYDDAFRTMAVECDDLLIPLLNHMFGEHYDASSRIVRYGNEHFGEDPEVYERKRITDSLIGVISDNVLKRYHIECESSPYDGSVLIRMFEYDAQIALDTSSGDKRRLRVNFPHSGLLELKRSATKPKEAIIEISTPGGTVEYPVKIVYESDFTMDTIFEKRLYFLIPFFIFNYEKELVRIDKDEKRLDELRLFYEEMFARLEAAVEEGLLSSFSKDVIMMLTEKVIRKLADKHTHVKEKVGDFMGGRVLDLDIIRIKHESEAIGRAQGIAQGIAQGEAEERARSEKKEKEMTARIEALEAEIKALKAAAGTV